MLVDPKWMRFYARMSGIVMAKVVLIALGYYVGSSLDTRYRTYPILLFVCVTVALAIGIFAVVWTAERESRLFSDSSPEPRGDVNGDSDDEEPPPEKNKKRPKSNPKIYT